MKKGFTLIEILIIIIIISIVTGIGLPMYMKAAQQNRDKKAIAMLKLIQGGQKIHEFETANYVSCSDAQDCNDQLNIDLPVFKSPWDYSVVLVGNSDFCAAATGTMGTQPGWYINVTMETPGDACP